MSISGNFTLFATTGGGGGGSTDFEKAAFKDITVAPTSNSGYNDVPASNPLGDKYGNNNQFSYGPTRLLIKDIVLITDKFKWVDGRPTWRVIFNEDFPAVSAYVTGMPMMKSGPNGSYLALQKNDVFGVCGLIENAHFLAKPDWNGVNKYDLYVDGAFDSSYTLPAMQNVVSGDIATMIINQPYVLLGTNTNPSGINIRDYRLSVLDVNDGLSAGIYGIEVSIQAGILKIFEGSSFVNKELVSQLGSENGSPYSLTTIVGNQIEALLVAGTPTYAINSYFATFTIGAGASGTNTIGVTAGTGSYFTLNQQVYVPATGLTASYNYYGVVTGISTDTLTVSPTLPIGFSLISVYPMAYTGASCSISASLYTFKDAGDPWTEKVYECNLSFSGIVGFSGYVSQRNIFLPGVTTNVAMIWEGYAHALDMTVVANQETPQIADYVIEVDNYPAGSYRNATLMYAQKVNLFSNAAPGWHKVCIYPGASLAGNSQISITEFQAYVRRPINATFGHLGYLDQLPDQAQFSTLAINATMTTGSRLNNGGLGHFQRLSAGDVAWPVGWSIFAENALYTDHISAQGSTTGLGFTLSFYGSGFIAGVGGPGLPGMIMAIDGVGVTACQYVSLGPDAWHTFSMRTTNATYVVAEMFDIYRKVAPVKLTQKFHYENNPELETIDTSPIGTVSLYAGLTAPRGWLFCDGQVLTKNRYPKLAKAINQSFGVNAIQKNTFKLPDMRGLFTRVLDTMQTMKGAGGNDPETASRTVAVVGGNAAGGQGSYQADDNQSHDHSTHAVGSIAPSGRFLNNTSPSSNYSGGGGDHFGASGFVQTGMRTGSDGATDARPRNIYLNAIIKAE